VSAYSDNFRLFDFSNETAEARARCAVASALSASDVMDPVQSQRDGRMYDSKSALRRTYREAGVTEVGNDPPRNRPFVRSSPRTSM
jgi:hypothetical protein